MLISIVGGLFCARVWSVAAVAVIAGLLFPTLLTLFVSPEWKRLGFERYFEMQAGNFIALAGYFTVICAIFAFGAHLLRHAIGLVARLAQRWHRTSDQEKVQNEATEGAHALIQPTDGITVRPSSQ
jgi:hypothetical protein